MYSGKTTTKSDHFKRIIVWVKVGSPAKQARKPPDKELGQIGKE